ncbi:MAG: hypothetical protein ACC658_12500 [Acidimicrobiia bacterium]
MDRWRKRKERKEAESAERKHQTELANWQDQHDHVDQLIYLAEHLEEVQEEAAEGGIHIRLKKGENVLAILQNGGLVEPRVTGSHFEGGSQGVSIRVMKGVNYRVGQFQGTFVRGDEEQTVIDTGGDIYITDQRIQYSSMNRNREWAWSKLVDIRHDVDATYMGVTNRQKTSGILYGIEAASPIQDRITLAMAIYDGEVEHLVSELKDQLSELGRSKPSAPPPLPA